MSQNTLPRSPPTLFPVFVTRSPIPKRSTKMPRPEIHIRTSAYRLASSPTLSALKDCQHSTTTVICGKSRTSTAWALSKPPLPAPAPSAAAQRLAPPTPRALARQRSGVRACLPAAAKVSATWLELAGLKIDRWMDGRVKRESARAHTQSILCFTHALPHHGRTHRLDILERELTLADHTPFAKKLSPPRPPGAVTISVGRANRMRTTLPPPALYPSLALSSFPSQPPTYSLPLFPALSFGRISRNPFA